MAYQTPIDNPLTASQKELIAKLGSMQNLMSINFFKKFNIHKDEQISAFDYLIKVMRVMGVEPSILLKSFIDSFLDTSKLTDFALRGMAQVSAYKNINLNPNSSYHFPNNPKKEEKTELVNINYNYLISSQIKTTLLIVVEGLKLQLIKDLMTLIFGSSNTTQGSSVMSENHDTSYNRTKELIEESYCGSEVFNPSVPYVPNNGDMEYNKITLKEKLESGQVQLKVSCQGVVISFPDNPSYLFSNDMPGINQNNTNNATAEQALSNCINFVNNQVRKKEGQEKNASSSQKSFSQLLLEKLITHITILLKPIFTGINIPIPGGTGNLSNGYIGIIKEIQNLLISQGKINEANQMDVSNIFPPTSCEIINNWDSNPDNWTTQQKEKSILIKVLSNMLLNIALGFLVSYLLKVIKEFIIKYTANKAINKAKRKIEKLKQRFMNERVLASQRNLEKATKQASLLTSIKPMLNANENSYI